MFWAKNSPSVPTMLRGWSWRSPIWNAGFSVRCDDGLPTDGVDPSVAVPAGALPTVELALVPAVVTAGGELGAVSRPTVAPVVASVDEPGEEPVEAPVVGEVAGLAVVGRAEVDALVPEAPVDAVSGVTVPEPVGDVAPGRPLDPVDPPVVVRSATVTTGPDPPGASPASDGDRVPHHTTAPAAASTITETNRIHARRCAYCRVTTAPR